MAKPSSGATSPSQPTTPTAPAALAAAVVTARAGRVGPVRVRLSIQVAVPGRGGASGAVEVRGAGGSVLARGTLRGGRLRLAVRRRALQPGRTTLRVAYAGDATTAPAVGTVTFRVPRRR